MSKYFIVILIVFISITEMFSQINICECYKYYFKAEKDFYNNNLDSVSFYYKKAFSNPVFGNTSNYFNAADKLIRIGKLEFAKELLMGSASKEVKFLGIQNFINRYPKINFSIDSSKLSFYKVDSIKLDKLLLYELSFLYNRDQMIRNEYEGLYQDEYIKNVDYGNFLQLKNIIDRFQGKFPDLNLIGQDGERYISTILLHFDIEWLSEIFPALIDAIHKGYLINEDLIYQIDRSIVDSGKVYIYDSKLERLVYATNTPSILNSKFFYQFYGGYEINFIKERGIFWWPFPTNLNKFEVNSLRSILCLDSLDDYISRKPYIKFINDEKFLYLINN